MSADDHRQCQREPGSAVLIGGPRVETVAGDGMLPNGSNATGVACD